MGAYGSNFETPPNNECIMSTTHNIFILSNSMVLDLSPIQQILWPEGGTFDPCSRHIHLQYIYINMYQQCIKFKIIQYIYLECINFVNFESTRTAFFLVPESRWRTRSCHQLQPEVRPIALGCPEYIPAGRRGLGVGLQQRGTIITKKTAKIRSDETIITKMRAKLVKMLTHVETIGDTTNSWGYIGNQ